MLVIDKISRKPIYEQVVEGIEREIVTGLIGELEQLPSIRELSSLLGINPNTIQKAYAELERDGIIYSLPARGSFVSSDLSAATNAARAEVCSSVTSAIRQARLLGVSKEELMALLEGEWR